MTNCQATAEPVAVRGVERGQGYLFSHNGHCYLITAKHVSGGRSRVQVIAEGALSGTASLRFPFWDGIDLAVGVVRRGAANRCSGSIDDLNVSSSSVGQSAKAWLSLIDDEGFVDKLQMNVLETRYLDLDAEFSGSDVERSARQGMSGGFLFVDGKPVGMAVESADGKSIRFMRAEEIHLNVSRWIGSEKEIRNPIKPDVETSFDKGLPLSIASVSAKAIGAEYLPENLFVEGVQYAFEPTRNAEIIFSVNTEEKATLSRVVLKSVDEAGKSFPRRVVIFASPDADGKRWKTFWSGEMSRDGVLDTGPRAQTWARRIKIVIASTWANGPVLVDSLVAQ